MIHAAALLLALSAPPAAPPPGPLADLVAALAELRAGAPVQARVEHRLAVTQGDEPAGPEGVVVAQASAGPAGLQVTWSPAVLAEADRDEQRRSADPEASTPVRDALLDLKPLALAHALDAAPELLRALREAELLEVRPEQQDGSALTLLVLKVTPRLGARDRKYVKELTATARLWLGPDGLPVASDQLVQVKGRALLVVSFESEQRETLRYARVGDRLVVVRREVEQRSAGAGEKSHRHAVTTVALAPGPAAPPPAREAAPGRAEAAGAPGR